MEIKTSENVNTVNKVIILHVELIKINILYLIWQDTIPYPRGIPFILVSKLFERLATESLRVVMLLYLIDQLAFSAAEATVLFHGYNTIGYLMAICGALLADCWVGRYWATLYTHIVFMVGMIAFVICAVRELHFSRELALVAAAVISVGNGCMKPCLVALSGDQFKLPEQQKQMAQFFSMFYFCLKISSVLMSAATPAVRSDIPGLSLDRGYLLVFGMSLAFVFVSIVVFLVATPFYARTPPSGNMMVKVIQCIWHAAKKKLGGPNTEQFHWLDHAEMKYGAALVTNSKILLNMLVMLLPIPVFWALNEQISSTWTLQAGRMSGDLGGIYTVKADQMQVVMQILVLVFIPLCDAWLYPALEWVGVKTTLEKIVVSGWLSALAFVSAGVLEICMRQADGLVHVMWMMPQYVLLAMAEAIVGVCGYVFVNTEAPASLKAVLQAALLMTHSFGNIIDAAVLGSAFFTNQVCIIIWKL